MMTLEEFKKRAEETDDWAPKWGYEMTIKLPETDNENCMWAISLLSNMARYTYKTERFFEPYQFVQNGGRPIRLDYDKEITGLLSVPDTEAAGTDTVYGRTDFIQFVGITEPITWKLGGLL